MIKEKLKGIIYKYTSPSGKVYIGQTLSEKARIASHISTSYNSLSPSYNLPFHKAIRKYGYKLFKYEVLVTIFSYSELRLKIVLDVLERHFIKKCNSFGKNGYNCSEGGEGSTGYKHTLQTRLRMRQNRIGKKHYLETLAKMSASLMGRKHSEETKKKISERAKGRITKQTAVYQILNELIVGEFKSIKEAAAIVGCARSAISRALKYFNTHTAGGYKWKYKD